jgi:hypothetical protein
MADSNYAPAGWAFRADATTSDYDYGEDMRPLVTCVRCGALVNGGGLSREKHDSFHAALANLFDMLSELTSSQG